MTTRLLTLIILASLGNGVLAEERHPVDMVGEQISIKMSGKLAEEFSKRVGIERKNGPADGYRISILGTITQKLPEGQFRIEHMQPGADGDKRPVMVKLTGVVDAKNIKTSVTPKGTVVLKPKPNPDSEPSGNRTTPLNLAAFERSTTSKDQTTHRLELSELKGLKIQTWRLIDEVAE